MREECHNTLKNYNANMILTFQVFSVRKIHKNHKKNLRTKYGRVNIRLAINKLNCSIFLINSNYFKNNHNS